MRRKKSEGAGMSGDDFKIILDYLIGIAQKLNTLTKELEEIRKSIDMMRDQRPDKDITDGINDIMSFSGRGKHDA